MGGLGGVRAAACRRQRTDVIKRRARHRNPLTLGAGGGHRPFWGCAGNKSGRVCSSLRCEVWIDTFLGKETVGQVFLLRGIRFPHLPRKLRLCRSVGASKVTLPLGGLFFFSDSAKKWQRSRKINNISNISCSTSAAFSFNGLGGARNKPTQDLAHGQDKEAAAR